MTGSSRHAPSTSTAQRRRASRAWLALPLLLATATLGACGEEGPGGTVAAKEPPGSAALPAGTPVILISIDTLRSDRLPAYGYGGTRTPAIDRVASEGILFERAYSNLSLTLPSHTTILSGLLPIEHGVRDNIGYPVPPDTPLLQRILHARGYATGAAVSSYVLRSTTGIAAGFDDYDDEIAAVSGVELGGLQRPGPETLRRAVAWLTSHRDVPFFYFFHIYEPHSPYDPAEPYASRTSNPYDGEVEEADAVIGSLIAELQRLGIWERALVVLLSDHGEGLGDHGEQEHEVLVYREMLQVPLIVKLPAGADGGRRIAEPAQLVDVAPTILGALGVPAPPTLSGRDLLAPGGSPVPILSESIYGRLHFGWADLASIVDGRHHYIQGDYEGGPDPELYDLIDDPGERVNLAGRLPARVEELATALAEYDRAIQPPSAADPDAAQQLAALGYLSSSSTDAVAEPRPRPDPKRRIGVLEELGRASQQLTAGKLEQAADAYRAVLQKEPQMAYGWEQLGKTLRKAGDLEAARQALLRAFELSGSSPNVAIALAELELTRGDLDAAEAHARLASSSLSSALDLLGQIALRRGDLDTAERTLVRALERREGRVEPLVTLVELRVRQERFDEALRVADDVEREFGGRTDREVLRGLEYQRGLALAALDRLPEAEQAFRAEIALSPGELAPYPRLALVLALQGRGGEIGAVLEQMVTRNPTPVAYAEAVRALRALGDDQAAAALLRSALGRWPQSRELRSLTG